MKSPWIRRGLKVAAVALALVQFVPYGRDHTNPPVRNEPAWSDPEVRALAASACFDCHSNETRWPWYSHVAPASWIVQSDVFRGREALNFSEWSRFQNGGSAAAGSVSEGEMPPALYLPLHPSARLDRAQKARLIAGFSMMFVPRQKEPEGEHEEVLADGD